MSDYAVVEDGQVVNVIVVDDQGFISAYEAEHPTYSCVDMGGASATPGIGWSYSASAGFTAPPPPSAPAKLVASPTSIPADGATASTVTWTAAEGVTAPASVQFNVNGTLETVATVNNSAAIQVTSTTAGDTVTVQCEGLSVNVSVS